MVDLIKIELIRYIFVWILLKWPKWNTKFLMMFHTVTKWQGVVVLLTVSEISSKTTCCISEHITNTRLSERLLIWKKQVHLPNLDVPKTKIK